MISFLRGGKDVLACKVLQAIKWRWMVERTFSGSGHCPIQARDDEKTTDAIEAQVAHRDGVHHDQEDIGRPRRRQE